MMRRDTMGMRRRRVALGAYCLCVPFWIDDWDNDFIERNPLARPPLMEYHVLNIYWCSIVILLELELDRY